MAIGFQVSFDAHDPAALGAFWAVALKYVEQPPPPGFDTWPDALRAFGFSEEEIEGGAAYALVDPEGKGPRLFFQKVPEGKTAKNRVHLDVNVTAPLRGEGGDPEAARAAVDEHAARLVEAGATKVRAYSKHGEYWVTLQDPEGNELCVQ
ncbi:VOC family protein [Streptomyces sp. 4N509B]|uniref:VOC family protein n=1 Tax=Streptomyces sp. 4N509B TaxID=3457413 RepID=UPI003FCF1889